MRFTYVEGDDLLMKPVAAELTFIDTWHTYAQLVKELRLWAPVTTRFLVSLVA
jgi:hypothetical protein